MIRQVLISSAVLAVLTCQAAVGAQVTRVSAENYWVARTLSGLINEKETETEIRWELFGMEGQRFIHAVEKRLLSDTDAKRRGLLKFLKDSITSLAGGEKLKGEHPSDLTHAGFIAGTIQGLTRMTGLHFAKSETWQRWFNQNNRYLVWSDRLNHFVLDREAKTAKVPTVEYRKEHPWPQEP